MSKWTPGPWRIAEADEAYDDDIIEITSDARAGMVPICRIGIGFRDEFDAEQRANARLIAQAPVMAEALREAMTDLVIAADNMDHAAKTDGRWEGCGAKLRARVENCRAALAEGRS